MFERILVPLDGSELSEAVLPYAEHAAEAMGSEVVLIRVVPSLAQLITMASAASATDAAVVTEAAEMELMTEEYDRERTDAMDYLNEIGTRLEGSGLHVTTVVSEGRAADSILDYARDHQIDAIAMSTHGRGGLGRLVFGSVTDEVLRHAPPVPLVLVRETEEEQAA